DERQHASLENVRRQLGLPAQPEPHGHLERLPGDSIRQRQTVDAHAAAAPLLPAEQASRKVEFNKLPTERVYPNVPIDIARESRRRLRQQKDRNLEFLRTQVDSDQYAALSFEPANVNRDEWLLQFEIVMRGAEAIAAKKNAVEAGVNNEANRLALDLK